MSETDSSEPERSDVLELTRQGMREHSILSAMAEVLRAAGFWSYVRADDDGENGRISDLAREVMSQYRLYTANDLRLFLDLASIEWGDDWRDRIDAALEDVTFFIPIITPSYFASSECRRELSEFLRRAETAELGELVLPIYYIELPDGLETSSEDPLIAALARKQYTDWRELRLCDTTSSEHRRGVDKLVTRLVSIVREVAARPPVETEPSRADIVASLSTATSVPITAEPAPTNGEVDIFESDEPGTLELIALGEGALPLVTEKLNEMTDVLQEVDERTAEAESQIRRANESGKGAAGRVYVTHQLAQQLETPADKMAQLGKEYSAALADADLGIRAVLDLADQVDTDQERDQACEMFNSLRGLGESSREAAQSQAGLIDTLTETARFSRALRPPLAKLIAGVRNVADGNAIIEGWIERIDESPLDCSGWSPATAGDDDGGS